MGTSITDDQEGGEGKGNTGYSVMDSLSIQRK